MSASPLKIHAAPRVEDDESGYTFTLPAAATVATIEAMQRTDAEALHSIAISGVRLAHTFYAVNGIYTRSALRTPSGVPVFTSGAKGDGTLHLFCSTDGVWYVGTADEVAAETDQHQKKRGVAMEEKKTEQQAEGEAASANDKVPSRKRRLAPRVQKRAARARVTAPPSLTRSMKRAELVTELREKVLVVPQSMCAGITLCSTDMERAGRGGARDTACFHSFNSSSIVGRAESAPTIKNADVGININNANNASSFAARECPSLRRFDILTTVNGVDARTVASFQEVIAMVLQASRPMTLIFETSPAPDERAVDIVAAPRGAARGTDSPGLLRSTTHSSSPLGLQWETRVLNGGAAGRGGGGGATIDSAGAPWCVDATVSVGSPVQCPGWQFRPFERRRWNV